MHSHESVGGGEERPRPLEDEGRVEEESEGTDGADDRLERRAVRQRRRPRVIPHHTLQRTL